MKPWGRRTTIKTVHSVRPAKRTHSKTGPARNDAVDCGCAGCADKSASLRQFFELTWRNWQTRTAQDRMGQPVEVRVLSRADSGRSERATPFQSERAIPRIGPRR